MGRFLTAAGLVVAALALLGCGSVDRGVPTEPAPGSSTTTSSNEAEAALRDCRPDPDAAAERKEKIEGGELSGKEAAFDEAVEVRGCMAEHSSSKVKEQICEVKVPAGTSLPPNLAKEQAEMLDAVQKGAGC